LPLRSLLAPQYNWPRLRRGGRLDAAFTRVVAAGAQALIVQTIFGPYVKQIAALALKYRLPAISDWATFTRAGGLLSYGANRAPNMAMLTDYVDRILKGAKPGDLPIQEPTRFSLTVNLKTAKALGVTIAPIVLVRADEVFR
jgi:putative ABC transport system substrate-binding protein